MLLIVVDYGVGNLRSIVKSIDKANSENNFNYSTKISSDVSDIQKADKLVLPGQGSFKACLEGIKNINGLSEELNESVMNKKKPIYGICAGMQLFGTTSYEEEETKGLNWIEGDVVKINPEPNNLKIPHMGWNEARGVKPSPVLSEPPERLRFYFANSYHVVCANPADVLLETEYAGFHFTSAIEKGHIRGAQFHPEKSHRYGMWFLNNFASRA